MSQFGGDTWFYKLKNSGRELINKAGGIEAAAQITSYSSTTVGRWNVQASPDLINLPAVVLLESYCGEPVVSGALKAIFDDLAGSAAKAFLPKFSVLETHAQCTVEFSHLCTEYAKAVADGMISPNEARRIRAEISDMMNSLSELDKLMIQAEIDGGLKVVSK